MPTARWSLLVGPKHLGSPVARRIAERLPAAGLRVAGFVQARQGEPGEEQYRIERLGTGERCAVARSAARAAAPGEVLHCDLVFDPAAFARAHAWVEADAAGADVVIVDCVGKLEVNGGGHHATVAELLRGPALPLLVVREDHLLAVMETFHLEEEPVAVLELSSAEADLDGFVAALQRAIAPVS
jgi:nucleoside-triphosphatase THEP1